MSRRSTFANAFASALAPYDAYSPEAVANALRDLGQNPDDELLCVYCGKMAATWDHVFNRVVKGNFSGHGHHIRNLVPCCRSCNESKGQKPWREFLELLNPVDKGARVAKLEKFLGVGSEPHLVNEAMRENAKSELEQFLAIRSRIFELMREADHLASVIREKCKI